MSIPKVWPSSTFTTPSLPTLSMASAMTLPIFSERAEMAPTREISARPLISLACSFIAATTTSTASSRPRRRITGFAPAATFLIPPRTMLWARTSAVVVPSPATSLVLWATSLTICAAWFSKMFFRSISCAIVTPSLVTVGESNALCKITYWPFGPSVALTASASLLTPDSSALRASMSNLSFLGAIDRPPLSNGLRTYAIFGRTPLLFDDPEEVVGVQDQVVVVQRDPGARVPGEDHQIALFYAFVM